MSNDPLLQPFKLKNLTFRNRLMTPSHEPAYTDDGMPKERACHVERAKAGLALTVTAVLADNGGQVEIMTHDRSFAPEVMAVNLRSLQKKNTKFTITYTLKSVEKDGNELIAIIGSDYCGIRREQRNDQIIVNHATRPNDNLYFDLKTLSVNVCEIYYEDLISRRPQKRKVNPEGNFRLFRIGDAVAARKCMRQSMMDRISN